jgi:signal-transduction protein with cAMP-binding, CBS, and nucleotidyltransferase domain
MKSLVEKNMTPKEKLITVTQLTSVRVILQKMRQNKVRTVIVEKSNPNGAYGLVTFKNILQSIVAADGDIDLLNAYDIMSAPVVSVSRKLEVRYAARMMVHNSIKRLLVIDDNELYGILTMSDILDVLMDEVENH